MDYELELEYNQISIDFNNFKSKFKYLEDENKLLKQQIEDLAIENSNLLEKSKKKQSQSVRDRWAFYHDNKEMIREKYNLTYWRLVKQKSDLIFEREKSISLK